jgi:hypothetical protein
MVKPLVRSLEALLIVEAELEALLLPNSSVIRMDVFSTLALFDAQRSSYPLNMFSCARNNSSKASLLVLRLAPESCVRPPVSFLTTFRRESI